MPLVPDCFRVVLRGVPVDFALHEVGGEEDCWQIFGDLGSVPYPLTWWRKDGVIFIWPKVNKLGELHWREIK